MLAKIWENEVNRIDNVRLSIIEYFSSFVVYAKVPMRKIYGSDSVPEKVIKILSITSEFYEVRFFPRFPREDFPSWAKRTELENPIELKSELEKSNLGGAILRGFAL